MSSQIETAIRGVVTAGLMKVSAFNRRRLSGRKARNPYLDGINAPMDGELTLTDLKVSGTIPPELNGRYLRIGPNPIAPDVSAAHHWFQGDGMVHGVALEDGKALWYKNRWIRSNSVSAALGEPPAPGPRAMSDTVNTNVVGLGGKIWALVEAGGFPVELNKDLETVAHNPFGGSLNGSFSAHPHVDPDTGLAHAICYAAGDDKSVRHVVVDAKGQVVRDEPIAVTDGPSIHDCMITANFVIVLDLPVTFSMKKLLAGYNGFPYAWNPNHQARVGILGKQERGTDIVWFDVEPCYVFHPCNAFETGDGQVIIDVVAHDSMFEDNLLGPSSKNVAFERWTINLEGGRVERKVIDPSPQEFPRPNETLIGKDYRYAYSASLAMGLDDEFAAAQWLYKHDLKSGTKSAHDFGADTYVGEFIFHPKADAKAEDDGWLMGYVVNMRTQTTDFVILNAQDIELPPEAVVTIPHRVPAGFHGNWIVG